MAGELMASLIKLMGDSALAGTAAKGTMDMNKKKENQAILDDGLLSSSKTKTETKKDVAPKLKTLSKSDIDDLMIMLVEGGLTSKEAKQIAKTGFITEEALKKLSPDAITNIEGLTGVPMTFPEGEKPEGTPPITGKVKKQTRTETPDGEVRETTTTFDSNSGIKKTSRTELPDLDLSELFPNIQEMKIDDITPDNPEVKEWAKKLNLSPEVMAREARARYRTHESLRGGIVETKRKAANVSSQANSIHGRTVEVDNSDVMPSHMTRAEQNQERHAGQERLARQILRNEAKAKDALLHKDRIK